MQLRTWIEAVVAEPQDHEGIGLLQAGTLLLAIVQKCESKGASGCDPGTGHSCGESVGA